MLLGGGLVVLRGGPLWTSTAAAVRTAGGRFANTVASSRHRQLSRGFRVGPIAKSYWGPQSHFSGTGNSGLIRQIERYTGREFQPEWTVYIIIGVNLLVFLMWQNHRVQRFMYNNFTMSIRGVLQEGRIHTLFTYMWSHQSLNHLLGNMITLWFFGTECVALLGAQNFLAIYMAAGLASGAAQLVWPSIARNLPIPARLKAWAYDRNLGASGAVNAVVAFSILTYPSRIILLWFILPVPASMLGLAWLAKDVVGLYSGDSNVGNAGHIAGTFVGAGAWALLRRRMHWY